MLINSVYTDGKDTYSIYEIVGEKSVARLDICMPKAKFHIDYDKVSNLASEARQKLKEVRPRTVAQAIRISGVNPADISILLVYLRKYYNE